MIGVKTTQLEKIDAMMPELTPDLAANPKVIMMITWIEPLIMPRKIGTQKAAQLN